MAETADVCFPPHDGVTRQHSLGLRPEPPPQQLKRPGSQRAKRLDRLARYFLQSLGVELSQTPAVCRPIATVPANGPMPMTTILINTQTRSIECKTFSARRAAQKILERPARLEIDCAPNDHRFAYYLAISTISASPVQSTYETSRTSTPHGIG